MGWDIWLKSGRVDAYRYDVLPLTGIGSKPVRTLTGVTDAEINYNWETSERVSGSLTVVNTKPVNDCYVRVWYRPIIDGKVHPVEMGTFYAMTRRARFESGQWSGTVTLKSVLCRYTEERLDRHWVLRKGESAKEAIRKVLKHYGGSYIIDCPDKKFSKTVVVEFGSTVFELLSKIAKVLGYAISVDTHGRLVLEKIMSAKKRAVMGVIPYGATSVTMPGIEMSTSWQATPNRYALMYRHAKSGDSDNEWEVFGKAQVPSGSANSPDHIGRTITKTETLTKLSFSGGKAGAQKAIDAKAKSGLGAATSITEDEYSFTCHYLPLMPNRVYRLIQNGMDERGKVVKGVAIDGIVKSIDFRLGKALTMDVTARKVRDR